MKFLFLVPFLTILFFHVTTATCSACAVTACNTLHAFLNEKVSFPSSAVYINESNSYWSAQESQLSPVCRVTPANALDVSTVLKVLVAENATFAVKSGGHMQWAGAANIDGGVTVDLSALNGVTVSTDAELGKVVNLGAGAKWGDVYAKLDPMGVTVAGARIPGAGVGGFLTGGGISFFASQAGFSCDNVVQYEVVLGNGTIITATANQNADLFMALKGGNNNFGIVTTFTMKAISLGPVWGGFVFYPNTLENKVLEAFYGFGEQAGTGQDMHTSVIFSQCTATSTNTTYLPVFYANTANIASPPILSNFTKVTPNLASTIRSADLLSLVAELGASPVNGQRELMAAVAFKNNLEMIQLTQQIHSKAFLESALKNVQGVQACFSLQPIHKAILTESLFAGGNILGLSPNDGNLVLAHVTLTWDNANDDAAVDSAAETWLSEMKSISQLLGVAHPFIYLNYAMPSQDPIAGYGAQSQAALRAASLKYDPDQVFQKLVPGGFKLSR